MQDLWTRVDAYHEGLTVRPDPCFERILQCSAEASLPEIHVSACQGRLLEILVRSVAARRVLEVGTLGGYSTAWLGRGLSPGGSLVTLELSPEYAAVACTNLNAFEFYSAIDIRVGDAVESLRSLHDRKEGPFDFVFLDADKTQYGDYLDWVIRLSRQGTLIVADNVVRDGHVVDEASKDAKVQGVRAFNRRIAEYSSLICTSLQTVGDKGYDGFTLIYVGT